MQRLSRLLLPTSKGAINSKCKSHELLQKAGFIRQSTSGIYTFLPFAQRVLCKIEAIIDQEMQKIHGQKLILPNVLASQDWKKTGRWNSAEMFKLKDRKHSEFLLGPTHEEEITRLVSTLVNSWRQLPIRLYQIGRKFRDELRPRSGLLRAREFVMKDMYSFDKSQNDALSTYEEVSRAYGEIFKRIGVPFVVAEADAGNIGGNLSHEYHIVAPVGEDIVLNCSNCGYTANVENAISSIECSSYKSTTLNCSVDGNRVNIKCLVPNQRELNPNLLKKVFPNIEFHDSDSDVMNVPLKIIADKNLEGIGLKDNMDNISYHHISSAEENDNCGKCQSGVLQKRNAIEVGHTFYLGTEYSKQLDARFLDLTQQYSDIEMGCYGIGISRLMAAVVEASNDRHGIIWPKSIAPYSICVIPVYKNSCDREYNRELDEQVLQLVSHLDGQDVVVDDRDVSFGFKIKDSQLVGYPITIIIGKSFQEKRQLEVINRKTLEKTFVDLLQLKSLLSK